MKIVSWFMTHIKETFYGREGYHTSPYLTRIFLTPHTRWGHLVFHIFYRGDKDPDTHDHPAAFWTFPLTTYVEQCLDDLGNLYYKVVPRFKWHYRPAYYAHRVLGPQAKRPLDDLHLRSGKMYSIVWWRPTEREWGFWVDEPDAKRARYRVLYGGLMRGNFKWVPWRKYVYGEESREERAAQLGS